MPFRQLAIVLLALIAIVGAGLFVLSIGDDEPDDTASTQDDSEADDSTTTSSTTTSSTTTIVPVTTSIPLDCAADEGDADEEPVETTTTTTTVSDEDPDGEGETDDDADADDEEPLPTAPTLDAQSSLSTVGLDEVTFGLTVNQASARSGTPMINCGPVNDCYRVVPQFAPDGISFVVQEGTIERADIVGNSPITTRSGAGIGTTSDELDALFGDRLERVDLGGGQEDVIFVPADENDQEFRVAWTVVDGVVETMRSGRVPLVLEPDPCG
ncbi:MAG: hypothetical protein AAF548_00525 [Actinomycetota bacterium]